MSSTAPSAPASLQPDTRFSARMLTRECLAGVVTALALIPEVISFSVISGVTPDVSLFASVVLCLVLSILGGRSAMVTAAAGSVALVIGPMVREHGVQYILPAVVLAGAIQIVFGVFHLARIMRYIPRSVMTGFVNALGILIFWAQVSHVVDKTPAVYALFAASIAIVVLLPRLTTAVPSALVAIVVATACVYLLPLHVPDVGGQGWASSGLPGLSMLAVPLNLDTLSIVWPTAVSVAFVGLMESLLTAQLVDELTHSRSSKSRESWGLGVGNIAAAFFGGIGGCAMIGQTVVNVKMGGARTRISTIACALTLLCLVTALSPVMARIPMVALAAIMMIVAIKTIDWHSLAPATLKKMPLTETAVMVMTVLVTLATDNLALGVACGVALAICLFARRVAQVIRVERHVDPSDDAVRYTVHGPLFFASSNDLFERFEYELDPHEVEIDFTDSRVWDASSIAALDAIKHRYQLFGRRVRITGMDASSAYLHDRLTAYPEASP